MLISAQLWVALATDTKKGGLILVRRSHFYMQCMHPPCFEYRDQITKLTSYQGHLDLYFLHLGQGAVVKIELLYQLVYIYFDV